MWRTTTARCTLGVLCNLLCNACLRVCGWHGCQLPDHPAITMLQSLARMQGSAHPSPCPSSPQLSPCSASGAAPPWTRRCAARTWAA